MPSPTMIAQWVVSGVGHNKPVRVGETWVTGGELAGSPVGGFGLRTQNTLTSATANSATIDFLGKAESSSAASPVSGFQLRQAAYKGAYRFDRIKGELSGMDSDMSVILDGTPGGLDISMAAKQSARLTRDK